MRKTLLKWTLLLILLAYVTAVAVWANGEATRLACRGFDVEISGNETADSVTIQGIRQELARYPHKIKGALVSSVNTKDVEDFLSRMSNFENVECWLTTDGSMKVAITPMIPELRVFDGDQSYYINKDGKRIESKASFFVDVPVATGHFTDQYPPRTILPLIRFINGDKVFSDLVGMVEVKDPDNIILVPRIIGHVINFGDTSRLKEKRDALVTFYRKVMPYKGWEEYDTIFLKFKGQIVASRRSKDRIVHGLEYTEDSDMEEATLPDEYQTSAEEPQD